jgi:hypothetical protein
MTSHHAVSMNLARMSRRFVQTLQTAYIFIFQNFIILTIVVNFLSKFEAHFNDVLDHIFGSNTIYTRNLKLDTE